MNRQRSHDGFSEHADEHDAPTEPMMPVVLSPTSPIRVDDKRIPVPQPYEQPFPQQHVRDASSMAGDKRQPAVPVYPYLPLAPPVGRGGRPAGGAVPVRPGKASHRKQPGRSALPGLVGLFFVCVQFLLLVNVVLQLLGLPGTLLWVNIIDYVSAVFVLPVRLLLQNVIPQVTFDWTTIYTLLAILLYGVLSRILVRLLRALLHAR